MKDQQPKKGKRKGIYLRRAAKFHLNQFSQTTDTEVSQVKCKNDIKMSHFTTPQPHLLLMVGGETLIETLFYLLTTYGPAHT